MTPEMEARRGEEARQLLEHPLLIEAFEVIEKEVTEQWQTSPARDVEGREKLWLSLKLLQRVRKQLEHVIETGQVAKATLAQQAVEEALRIGRKLTGYSKS